jgi:hypothetical protein
MVGLDADGCNVEMNAQEARVCEYTDPWHPDVVSTSPVSVEFFCARL